MKCTYEYQISFYKKKRWEISCICGICGRRNRQKETKKLWKLLKEKGC